eukprot:487717-Rhodomonas_salina.2
MKTRPPCAEETIAYLASGEPTGAKGHRMEIEHPKNPRLTLRSRTRGVLDQRGQELCRARSVLELARFTFCEKKLFELCGRVSCVYQHAANNGNKFDHRSELCGMPILQ